MMNKHNLLNAPLVALFVFPEATKCYIVVSNGWIAYLRLARCVVDHSAIQPTGWLTLKGVLLEVTSKVQLRKVRFSKKGVWLTQVGR